MTEDLEYESGAIRERKTGKGRYDLISPYALEALAMILEEGAERYGERNWEQGLPLKSFIDSALRHINRFMQGHDEEDHLTHALWNIHSAVHMMRLKSEFRGTEFDLFEGMPDEVKEAFK